jgi:Sec-independent protein translocase protein TatA
VVVFLNEENATAKTRRIFNSQLARTVKGHGVEPARRALSELAHSLANGQQPEVPDRLPGYFAPILERNVKAWQREEQKRQEQEANERERREREEQQEARRQQEVERLKTDPEAFRARAYRQAQIHAFATRGLGAKPTAEEVIQAECNLAETLGIAAPASEVVSDLSGHCEPQLAAALQSEEQSGGTTA